MIKTIATRLLELFGLATLLTGCGSLKPIVLRGQAHALKKISESILDEFGGKAAGELKTFLLARTETVAGVREEQN